MAIKTHKVTLSLDNPRVIQSGINVQSFDKQSIQISIELTKNDEVFQVPSDATIRISLLKLARQEQKIIVDVPNTNRDSIDWIVPDYLDGYQGTVRVGVYLVTGAENVDLGYFTILSNVSDIDKMADEFTDNVFQGWEQIEADLNELNLTIAQTKLDLAEDLTQIDNTITNINTLASDFTTDVATKQADVTSKYNAFDTDITEANQTIDDILALQPQFQSVLDETTGKDVISAPEIILARNGEANLKARLDKEQQQVTAQLAQKANLDSVFTMANMAQDVKEAMTGGSVAVVGARGADVGNTTGELYQSFLKTKHIVHSNFEYVNLFDKARATNGAYVSDVNGNTISTPLYCYSHNMAVEGGATYTASTPNIYTAFFDNAGVFISGTQAVNKLVAPSNASYIVISPKIEIKNTLMLVKGDVVLGEYYDYLDGKKQVSLDIPLNDENLSPFIESIQLIDFDDLTVNGRLGYVKADGTWHNDATYKSTDYIKIDPSKTYRVVPTANKVAGFYDANKNFVEYRVAGEFGSLPPNVAYIRFAVKIVNAETNEYENIMLTSDENITEPIPYKKTFKRDYIPLIDKSMISGDIISSPNLSLKLQLFGDSITDDTWWSNPSWVDYINETLGENVTITNSAIGGSKLSEDGAATNSIVELITDGTTLKSDNDVVLVFGGTNDWSKDQQLGTFLSNDITTIYGAVKKIIETAVAKDSLLIFATPLKRNHTSDAEKATNSEGLKINANGNTLNDFCEAITKTCEWYGIPYVDLNKTIGINELNVTRFTSDGLHPYGNGNKLNRRISSVVCNFVKNYF